jgi:hypothetical protein
MTRNTVFSPCRRYRYTLWREWGRMDPRNNLEIPGLGTFFSFEDSYVQFIGLNPSTADETQDDPTVRRCIQYAKDWGFGALCMTNAFAWRDTDPEKMKAVPYPIGEMVQDDEIGAFWQQNDIWLNQISAQAGLVIAAWGKNGRHLGRDAEIKAFIPDLHCLGVNADGTPKHPLYLRKTLKPVPLVTK